MRKNQFSMRTLAFALLMGGASATLASCSQTDDKAATSAVSAEGDQAYNNLATFVDNSEAGLDGVADQMKADYDQSTTQMQADYEAKKAEVAKYADKYDENRRQEIEKLNGRYTAASEKRTASWTDRTKVGEMGKYYKPMSAAGKITAANAKATYSSFVDNVVANKDKYDINDWRNVNAEWRALDEAYDNVKGGISVGDLASIQKEKLKYAGVKSWDKTKIRSGQGADAVANTAENVVDKTKDAAQNVKEETADERSRAGQAISNTASDVKEAGKDIGQGAAKVGKKVGGAVKDVFDGKDEKKN